MNVKTDLEAILECNTRARNDVTFAKSRVAAAGCEQSAMALRILVEATNALANQKRLIKEALESLSNEGKLSEETAHASDKGPNAEISDIGETTDNKKDFDRWIEFRDRIVEICEDYLASDEVDTTFDRALTCKFEGEGGKIRLKLKYESE